MINVETPFTRNDARKLRAGDEVVINGTIYTARDAAHKRLINLLDEGKRLPFDIRDQIIYYVGPCPPKPGFVCGSAGPTTSGRMDAYTPRLLECGMSGMIGKGLRSKDVVAAMMEFGAVYFGAIGGAGALISKAIKDSETIAFPELGTEAIHRLTVKDFPAVVVIDSLGNDLYEKGRELYRIY